MGHYNTNRPSNTKKAYKPKMIEWRMFCDHVYPNMPVEQRYLVHDASSYRFMLFQAMRSKRWRGGYKGLRKRKRAETEDGDEEEADPDVTDPDVTDSGGRGWKAGFTGAEYDEVMRHYSDERVIERGESIAEPTNANCHSLLGQYKAALRVIWQEQLATKQTPISQFEAIWDQKHFVLMDLVKGRRKRIAKSTYQEKLSYEATPYKAVGEVSKIEEALWNNGKGRSPKAQLSWLRHRFCFLFTFRGILRAESLMNAEISDFLMVTTKLQRDPDPLEILMLQIANGKLLFVLSSSLSCPPLFSNLCLLFFFCLPQVKLIVTAKYYMDGP